VDEALEKSSTKEFVIDGFERPIQRPTDNEKQKKHYSGKQKRHTCKNNHLSRCSNRGNQLFKWNKRRFIR
jgi:hypothetical protein